MTEQSAERDHIVRVLTRHHFVAAREDTGFCGGPYCVTGIVSIAAHAEHVAYVLLSSRPGQESGG